MKCRYLMFPLKNYFRVVRNKIKYPHASIDTPYICNCEIGKNCTLNKDVILLNVKIGEYSYVNRGSILGICRIGKFTSIGYNCEIGGYKHPYNYMSTSPYTYGPKNIFGDECIYNQLRDEVCIGNDVWIGSKSIIMQGVTIGDGAVIGANSVVTHDVKPYEIVVGNPARHLKYRFSQEIIEKLNELKWWDNYNTNEIREIMKKGENFIKYL